MKNCRKIIVSNGLENIEKKEKVSTIISCQRFVTPEEKIKREGVCSSVKELWKMMLLMTEDLMGLLLLSAPISTPAMLLYRAKGVTNKATTLELGFCTTVAQHTTHCKVVASFFLFWPRGTEASCSCWSNLISHIII